MFRLKSSLVLLLLFLTTNALIFSQNVTSKHVITKGSLPNEYSIKTTINGLEGVDLARIKYFIPQAKQTYKASSNNQFFSKIEDEYVKFYIMAIPTNGVIEIEFNVIDLDTGSVTFPIEFQYSKNDEKTVLDIDPIVIVNNTELLAEAEDPSLNDKIQAEVAKGEAELAAEKEAEKAKISADELAAKNKADEAALILAASTAAAAKEKEVAVAKQNADEEAARLKEQQEAEALATKNKEVEAAKQLEAQQLKEQQAATLLALEKEKAEAAAILAAQKEQEVKAASTDSGVKYGVQLFALSKYTEQKVKDFCKTNKLDYAKISTLKVDGVTKVRYGAVSSKTEANALREDLLSRPQINGGFVVKL